MVVRKRTGVALVAALVAAGGCGSIVGWAAKDVAATGPDGLSPRDVYLAALEAVAEQRGLDPNFAASIVEYDGAYCGGIVSIRDQGHELIVVVGEDSGDPVPRLPKQNTLPAARADLLRDQRCHS
ncbi:MAG: hypothetical protein JWO68_2631 [Actinomycetia bacterium]|nr:hypothetical protein [Actinomycetes bacterium]